MKFQDQSNNMNKYQIMIEPYTSNKLFLENKKLKKLNKADMGLIRIFLYQ